MDYIEADVTCPLEWRDIYIAWLGEKGYDSFEETATGFKAFITKEAFVQQEFEETLGENASYRISQIPAVNWNKEWEANFQPVEVNDQCIIRAPFHVLSQKYAHELIIQPKMSFGTGHHATTRLMLQAMLNQSFANKKVFDFGSGTGILSIMALKLGATSLWALDNDEWSYENARENFMLNEVNPDWLHLGLLTDLPEGNFDMMLANINKNVILDSLPMLADKLKPGGLLFTSGFFSRDVADISNLASAYSLKVVDLKTENNWAMVLYMK